MNKKGSAVVEAVMVFPVVIISITAMICMMTYFYMQVERRVDIHVALRAECGQITGTVIYKNVPDNGIQAYRKAQQVYSSQKINSGKNMFLLKREKTIEARKYIIDEAKFVRTATIFNEGSDDDD